MRVEALRPQPSARFSLAHRPGCNLAAGRLEVDQETGVGLTRDPGYMAQKLELIREEKLFRLLPRRTEKSRLEASGVALLDAKTALVVFDNLNQVARINLSLKRLEAMCYCLLPVWDWVSRTLRSTAGIATYSA